jgi:hypothetical protein
VPACYKSFLQALAAPNAAAAWQLAQLASKVGQFQQQQQQSQPQLQQQPQQQQQPHQDQQRQEPVPVSDAQTDAFVKQQPASQP